MRHNPMVVLMSVVSGIVVVVSGMLWPACGLADVFQAESLLASNDPQANDYFGRAVDINGDYAIVGAPGETIGGHAAAGYAYIFRRSGGSWTLAHELAATNPADLDFFGLSVAIGDTFAVVGAEMDDEAGADSGAAYVFRISDGSLVQKLMAGDAAAGDSYGVSVDIDGNYLIVGAHEKSSRGAAYIYTWDGSSWTDEYKLTDSGGASQDLFGCAVGISSAGPHAIVGAYAKDAGADTIRGAAFIYHFDGMNWIGERLNYAGSGDDRFGFGVGVGVDTAIVGAPWDNGKQGSAHVYTWDGASWNTVAATTLTAGDGAANEYFGASVRVHGDYAIVGAWKSPGGGAQGAAYIFDGLDGWSQLLKLSASGGQGGDFFGGSVSLSYDAAIVGAYGSSGGDNTGAVYVYKSTSPPVPTLSQWGVIIMSLLMAGMLIRRSRGGNAS